MNTEEVEKEYCSRCTFYKYECGFITRGLQDKCSQLSDYVGGYERGYEQAREEMIDKLRKWIACKNERDSFTFGYIDRHFDELLKQAMKDE